MQRRDSGALGTARIRNTLGGRRATMRIVQDGSRMIVVYEQEQRENDPWSGTLVFESGDSVTHLSRYPDNWRRMRDDELLALPKMLA